MVNPLVSVIIPVYNGSNFLREAIESALAQTYNRIEIIVVNDGSKDNGATEKVALSYGDKIRYFSKANGGVSSALNLGISKMKGEYFSWLSHDDMYTSDKILNEILEINDENKDSIIICNTSFINETSKTINRKMKQIKPGGYNNTQMLSAVFSGYSISGCALLIPKHVFEVVGTFDEGLRYMQDMELWYRMMIKGIGFYVVNKPGVLSRVHEKQLTVTGKELGKEDAKKVGIYMISSLKGLFNDKENLLKSYMFLCYKRNSDAADCAFSSLEKDKELNIFDYLKFKTIKLYGKMRPMLVRIYYKLFFNVKVKR